MILPDKVIKEARITEKATALSANENKYTFEVYPNVNSVQVKQAIEKMFNVDVAKVNIVNIPGKLKRMRTRVGTTRLGKMKKAIVTLKEGHKIELV